MQIVIVIQSSCYEGGYSVIGVFSDPANVDEFLASKSEAELFGIEISVWDTVSGSELADIEFYTMHAREEGQGFKRVYDVKFSEKYAEWLESEKPSKGGRQPVIPKQPPTTRIW